MIQHSPAPDCPLRQRPTHDVLLPPAIIPAPSSALPPASLPRFAAAPIGARTPPLTRFVPLLVSFPFRSLTTPTLPSRLIIFIDEAHPLAPAPLDLRPNLGISIIVSPLTLSTSSRCRFRRARMALHVLLVAPRPRRRQLYMRRRGAAAVLMFVVTLSLALFVASISESVVAIMLVELLIVEERLTRGYVARADVAHAGNRRHWLGRWENSVSVGYVEESSL
jgi:hypothetical protein